MKDDGNLAHSLVFIFKKNNNKENNMVPTLKIFEGLWLRHIWTTRHFVIRLVHYRTRPYHLSSSHDHGEKGGEINVCQIIYLPHTLFRIRTKHIAFVPWH